jgi:hypothetical protein
MPGFLDDLGYSGTTTIDLGKDYWVTVKNCLTEEEIGFVNDLLGGKQRVDVGRQQQYAEMNVTASRKETLVNAIVDWNITGEPFEEGEKWPLLPAERKPGLPYPANSLRRLAVAALPAAVSTLIYEKVDALNALRTGREAAQFPDQPVGGDPDGSEGPGDPSEVPG